MFSFLCLQQNDYLIHFRSVKRVENGFPSYYYNFVKFVKQVAFTKTNLEENTKAFSPTVCRLTPPPIYNVGKWCTLMVKMSIAKTTF